MVRIIITLFVFFGNPKFQSMFKGTELSLAINILSGLAPHMMAVAV